jgi:hypothetical protein
MDAYRPREPPKKNENVTHKTQISPPPCHKVKTYSTMANGWQTDITRLHDKQVKLHQTNLLNKQATSSLHAAVVKADDTHHWIYFVQMKMNSPQTKNIITKSKDNGTQKPYTADTRMTANNM